MKSVEYCDGLCLDPQQIHKDALSLMALSGTFKSLSEKSQECKVTSKLLNDHLFREISRLVVSLSLKSRLWNDSYKAKWNGDISGVPNDLVGVRIKENKTKKIKFREALSFIAHANGFWLTDDGFLGVRVVAEKSRINIANATIDSLITTISDQEGLDKSTSEAIIEILKEEKEVVPESAVEVSYNRFYELDIDKFACCVCKVIDYCEDCAGESKTCSINKYRIPLALEDLS